MPPGAARAAAPFRGAGDRPHAGAIRAARRAYGALAAQPGRTDAARAEKVNSDMVMRDIGMDGTCTGEHGVGMHKMDFLVEEHGVGAIDTMRAVKHALDPKNIMNPGKIVRW